MHRSAPPFPRARWREAEGIRCLARTVTCQYSPRWLLDAAGDHGEELVAAHGAAQHRFEHVGGYDYEVRIAKVLAGLGLPRAAWDTPLDHLSGGQKTRALLAHLLLEAPDLLILDEPTNHLDIPSQETLQEALERFEGTLLLVSHDRYLVDRLATQVWGIREGRLHVFRGSYQERQDAREAEARRALEARQEAKEGARAGVAAAVP
jgi:ATP-binding cassette subfamily F protein 3